MGCSPWGHEESGTTGRLHFHFSLSGIGEGNGNPLQCSCLENPRDGGAWWAAIYGVAQSWTRPKRLSSSSVYLLIQNSLLLPLPLHPPSPKRCFKVRPSAPSSWPEIAHLHDPDPDSSVGNESACSAGDPGYIPGLGRSPGEGMGYPLQYLWASLVAQLVKNPLAMWETWVQSLGQEDPLEKG